MKKALLLSLSLGMAFALGSLSVSAQVIGFAFDEADQTTGNPPEPRTGVLDETFVNYNAGATADGVNLGVNAEGYQYRDGTAGSYNSAAEGNITPFQGLVFNTDTLTFTLTGLTAGQTYEVAVYSGISGEATEVDLGGVTSVLNTENDGTSFVPVGDTGANYAEAALIAVPVSLNSTQGEIIFTAEQPADGGGDGFNIIDGVSISDVVPEPNGMLLFGAGLLALLGVQRHRLSRQV